MPGGLWVWTASRAFLKVLVKMIVFLVNFCCLCTCEWMMDRRGEKKKLHTRSNQKKMYTNDLLQIIGNPKYNPISDPAYDIDKYAKLCAGIFFVCEGEVLLLQRNSNNNDMHFDLPGGTLDYEDFDQYYNSLLSKQEYKKKLKNAKKTVKKGIQGRAHDVADGIIDRVEGIGERFHNFTNPSPQEGKIIIVDPEDEHYEAELLKKHNENTKLTSDLQVNSQKDSKNDIKNDKNDQKNEKNNHQSDDSDSSYHYTGPISHEKRQLYPQIPLYDSFYYADIFSSQFQTLGLNAWQQQGQMKRKQLKRLHEQSIRHHQHGFGFNAGTWHGAVRETNEEIDTFPQTITPLAIFNIYRGWTEIDDDSSDSDDSSSGDDDDHYNDENNGDFRHYDNFASNDANFHHFYPGIDPESRQLLPKIGQNGKNRQNNGQNGQNSYYNGQTYQNQGQKGQNYGPNGQNSSIQRQKEENHKKLNINMSLLGNGKLIGDNFRRYTLYVCSITPEQRNLLTKTIKLSEEHSSYGWFPLCLLIPMQATSVSTFRHFKLHPWIVAFIEQYSSQFDKLARKTFWVGYNRHFNGQITVKDMEKAQNKIDNDEKINAKKKKEKKIAKKAAKKAMAEAAEAAEAVATEMAAVKMNVVSGNDAIFTPATTAIGSVGLTDQAEKVSAEKNAEKISTAEKSAEKVSADLTDGLNLIDILGDTNENGTTGSDDEDGTDGTDGNDDEINENNSEEKKKKKNGDGKKKKDKKKKKKQEKLEKIQRQEDEVIINDGNDANTIIDINIDQDDDKINKKMAKKDQKIDKIGEKIEKIENKNNVDDEDDDDETDDEGFPLAKSFNQEYYQEYEIPVEFDGQDIFISTFLPLVKKYINPKVYL